MAAVGTSGNAREYSVELLESTADSSTAAVGVELELSARELATSGTVDVAAIFFKIASNSDSNSASSMTLSWPANTLFILFSTLMVIYKRIVQ